MDLWEYNMIDVLRLLQRKEVSVHDYVRCLIDRCQEHQDLNVFISFNPEMVLSAAEKADGERMGGRTNIGPLHGIPIVLKDNIDIKNWPTSAATPALKGHYPIKNALIVSALLRAGAIPFGKANMHELAQGVTNNNAFFGACLNPFDRSKIPGGSSGGCSVAVAARLSPAAIGTDTGGSVRIPASLCGIVGFRPTVGRYPTKGIVPISHTRDTPGPMARSVADVSLLDRVLSKDPEPVAPVVLKDIRLGVPRKPFYANLVELNGVMVPLFQSFIRNTSPGSVVGIPGLNLYSGMTPDGLPVGMEIDGLFGSDRRLLAIGMAIEEMEPILPTPRMSA